MTVTTNSRAQSTRPGGSLQQSLLHSRGGGNLVIPHNFYATDDKVDGGGDIFETVQVHSFSQLPTFFLNTFISTGASK